MLGDGVDRAVGRQVALDEVWSRIEIDQLNDGLGRCRLEGLPGEAPIDDPGPGTAAAAMATAMAAAIDRRLPADWAADPLVVAVMASIAEGGSADPEQIGSRQLRRRFVSAIGYGPALRRRIGRLDRFTDLLAAEPHRPLADLAADAGFYDQAHLARDCRRLLERTPGEIRAAR